MAHNYILVINYGSRSARKMADALIEKLNVSNKITLSKIYKITDTRKLTNVFKKISTKDKPDYLILASGDGTISEAVDYISESDIVLCIIPLGTTNNFARSLRIPQNIQESVDVIERNKFKIIDLGKINEDYFANVAGIGISALVAKNVKPKDKKKFGRAAYAITGLKTLIKHKPFDVIISDKDNELSIQFETHQIIIANGRYHAGKKIAIGASLDSRELVVFKLGGRSKLSFIWHMLDFYIGKRRNVSHNSYMIARNISIKTSGTHLVELDGEVKLKTPLDAQVVPKIIRVIC
jgi:diacylglycerol kinase (ATP)